MEIFMAGLGGVEALFGDWFENGFMGLLEDKMYFVRVGG